MLVIGLTGTKASGKGEAANYLKNKGLLYCSLSDIVREEAVARGLKNYTIKQLQDIGNELREHKGLGILAEMTLMKIKEGDYVIDGIRNPGEIKILRWPDYFYLVSVDAPQEQRYERLIARKRPGDVKTLFLETDVRDLGIGEQNVGQQVAACMKMADYFIENDSTIEELHEKIDDILKKIQKAIL